MFKSLLTFSLASLASAERIAVLSLDMAGSGQKEPVDTAIKNAQFMNAWHGECVSQLRELVADLDPK
jgi:hypothetical protein